VKRIAPIVFAGTLLLFFLALHGLSSETPALQPLTLPLGCATKDCPLLKGRPQTAGIRSGFVRLKRGESVGWHTTGQNEEELIILKGRGEALIEGQPGRTFASPGLVYIPPQTRHNVANAAEQLLEYVYVVAPTKAQ
jgi:quercetin dioxygenase-like cupin family protein